MLLSEFFDQLTYGEFAQLSIGGEPKGEISPSDYPRMISHVNAALTRLHTRFLIREDEVIIQQYDHITQYYLRPEYAQSNVASLETYKYIIDSAESPFLDNVLRIERAYEEDGEEIVLNQASDERSVFTPRYDTIQIPHANSANAISVVYRGNHPKIDLATTDPSTVEIFIPPSFIEALGFYVASRMYAPMGTTEQGNESTSYYARYEAACQTLERYGMLNADNSANTKLEMNGWV